MVAASATREAERILYSGYADEALVLRLATDKRMRSVWRVLSKHRPAHRPQLSEAWASLMNDRVDVRLPKDVDALALFFLGAYTLAWLGAEVGTVSTVIFQSHCIDLRQLAYGFRRQCCAN